VARFDGMTDAAEVADVDEPMTDTPTAVTAASLDAIPGASRPSVRNRGAPPLA
jgi:hypothetical protein